MRLEDRALLVGETGCGKSTLAAYIVEGLQPVRTIVVDPKDELELGVAKARSAAELDFSGPVIHYVPASFDRDDLEQAAQRIWRCPGPLVILIDELAEISAPNYCPEGFRLAAAQGRSKRKAIVACTQRLAECHPCFRSQATHRFLMCPAPIDLDLQMMARHIGVEAAELKRDLNALEAEHGPHAHLWHVGPGKELRRCAPLPADSPGQPRSATANSGRPATTPETDPQGSLPCEESDSASGPS